MQYGICCFRVHNAILRVHFSKKRELGFAGRGVRKSKILPTLLLDCFILFENMAFDFKYLLKEYINKSLPTSPHGTTMLFAPCSSARPLTRTFPDVPVPTAVLISRLIAWWDCDRFVGTQLGSLVSQLTDFCRIKNNRSGRKEWPSEGFSFWKPK